MADTALAAMKRAAKAVLKDECATARKRHQKLADHATSLEQKVKELEHALRVSLEVSLKAREDAHLMHSNVIRLKHWAEVNAKGNAVVGHVLDAVVFKATYGSVHPFARWDLPPLK